MIVDTSEGVYRVKTDPDRAGRWCALAKRMPSGQWRMYQAPVALPKISAEINRALNEEPADNSVLKASLMVSVVDSLASGQIGIDEALTLIEKIHRDRVVSL